jgi:hypothetical protein
MVKNIVRVLVMSGVIAVLTTSTQALRAVEHGERFDSQQGAPADRRQAGGASWTTEHDLSSRLPPTGLPN